MSDDDLKQRIRELQKEVETHGKAIQKQSEKIEELLRELTTLRRTDAISRK